MRESGYYWVRYKGKWEVARWNYEEGWWDRIDSEHAYTDSDFYEIDETKIERK